MFEILFIVCLYGFLSWLAKTLFGVNFFVALFVILLLTLIYRPSKGGSNG